MTTPTQPLAWIQTVASALAWTQEIPLFGFSPSFDSALWSEKIRTFLGLSHCEIKVMQTEILSPEKLLKTLSTNPVITPLALPPLAEGLHFVLTPEDLGYFSQAVLNPKGNGKGFSSPAFTLGFYRYLLLQLLHFFSQEAEDSKPWKNLSLKIGQDAPLPTEEALCITLKILIPGHQLTAYLVMAASFQQAFKNHFQGSLLEIPKTRAETIPVTLSCEIGHTTLSLMEWETVSIGDCVVLDRCSYDLKMHKGTAALNLEGIPLFRARLKDQQIKITDYAFYYEEIMDETPADDPIPADREEEEDGDLTPQEDQTIEGLLCTEAIELTLTVEVARVKMDLAKLLSLQPGNLLELALRPEQGVSLVIGGKKVATGELVKIGETLGVKILNLG